MSARKLVYRTELDGLRGIAVLTVMIFHAGVDSFKGGFLAVDMFFVLSGYLITRLALLDLQAGRFTVADFISRRFRRIAPALCFTLVLSIPFAAYLLPMRDLRLFSETILTVLSICSNVYFWRTMSYFDPATELNAWIHAWSLSVEEQFYLAYPLVLLLCFRMGGWTLRRTLWLGLLSSFALSVWATYYSPVAAFYLLPTRIWEFCLGALLGERMARLAGPDAAASPATTYSRDVLGWLGLLLYVLTIATEHLYRGHDWVGHLGSAGATAMLLQFSRAGGGVGRLLCMPGLNHVGIWSYSTYLFHQPVFAFMRHASAEPVPSMTLVAVVPAVIGAAYLGWRYVETPFRDPRRVSGRWMLCWTLGLSTVVAAFGLTGWLTNGLPTRYDEPDRRILSFLDTDFRPSYRAGTCFVEPKHRSSKPLFDACEPPAGSELTIIGDSYAAALAAGLRANGRVLTQWTVSGCVPTFLPTANHVNGCAQAYQEILARLTRQQPAQLIVHAHWLHHRKSIEGAAPVDPMLRLLTERLPNTRIWLVGNAPNWYGGLPRRMVNEGKTLEAGLRMFPSQPDALATVDSGLATAAQGTGTRFLSVRDIVCTAGGCEATAEGPNGSTLPASWDEGHFTDAGARRVGAAVWDSMRPALNR